MRNKHKIRLLSAKASFQAKTPLELSFKEGQVLHLQHKIDENWYYAYDPSTKNDGYVPRNFFNLIDESSSSPSQRQTSSNSKRTSMISQIDSPGKATVLHDFTPIDELEMNAKAGDRILVLDDSDPDWILAVHDGKLVAKPQIIPRSYVEMITTPGDDDDVETELSSVATQTPVTTPLLRYYNDSSMSSFGGGVGSDKLTLDQTLILSQDDDSIVKASPLNELKARVVGYFNDDMDDEWTFVVRLNRGKDKEPEILYREYEDFYLMHFALVRDFQESEHRIRIPVLPGTENRNSTAKSRDERRIQFDIYLQELCDLPARVLKHREVMRFFAFRPGADGLRTINPTDIRRKREFSLPEWITRQGLKEMPGVIGTKKAKINLNGDTYALKLSTEEGLESFQLKLLKKFKHLTFADVERLYCTNDEGEWITIENSKHFKTILNTSSRRNIYFKLSQGQ